MIIINQRCTRCLMPNSYPGIWFNEKGICNQCFGFKKNETLNNEILLPKLESSHRDKYDCVIGISGGRDSSYVAYFAKIELKLRVLAVFYDSPFYCELAKKNIKNVCKTLDIDLITINSKNNLEYNLLRNHIISIASTGTSWGQCIFCHYGIDAILFNIAKEHKVPFILSGITTHELWNPGNRTKILFKRIIKLKKNNFLRFIYFQAKAYCLLVEQRRQFNLPSNSIFNVYKRAKLPSNGPDIIHLFDYIDWNYKKIEQILMEKAGWEKPDKSISWRYDCYLEPLLDYTYKKEFGISTVGIYLSSLIRSGQIERENALNIINEYEDKNILKNKAEFVFNYLHIPKSLQDQFFM